MADVYEIGICPPSEQELQNVIYICILLIYMYVLSSSLQHDYLNNLYSDELMRFLSPYKFMIAIENGVCEDYITEKYWRPLIAGIIPIYFGSPSIRVCLQNSINCL